MWSSLVTAELQYLVTQHRLCASDKIAFISSITQEENVLPTIYRRRKVDVGANNSCGGGGGAAKSMRCRLRNTTVLWGKRCVCVRASVRVNYSWCDNCSAPQNTSCLCSMSGNENWSLRITPSTRCRNCYGEHC